MATLVCPHDRTALDWRDDTAVCSFGHQLPVVHGVPVALRDDLKPTHALWRTTRADARRLSADARIAEAPAPDTVDRFVENTLVATCGNLYRGCTRPLRRYPIPDLRLPHGDGRLFLDIGANWGRWSFAAARRGYRVIAVDPSLEAALAGSRIARQLRVAGRVRRRRRPVSAVSIGHLRFRVLVFGAAAPGQGDGPGDPARHCTGQPPGRRGSRADGEPFRSASAVKPSVRARAGRRPVPHAHGRPSYDFRVRAWTPGELLRTFSNLVGPSNLTADGFFSLNARPADVDLLKPLSALIVRVSEHLRALADQIAPLARLADSVWIESRVETTPALG